MTTQELHGNSDRRPQSGAEGTDLDERSKHLRRLVLRGVCATRKGHVGSALSAVEIIRVLYDDIMNYRADSPRWPDRDRFILSKGHGCLALYAILADKKFIAVEELDSYAMDGSRLGGCSESIVPGVEATTGALGHGFPVGIGMAVAARVQGRPSRIYVMLGDGELDEGSIWEGALFAAKHELSNLTAIVDRNRMQIAGPTRVVLNLEPLRAKWEAFGFACTEVDGHDVQALRNTFKGLPLDPRKPSVVICHTIKGKGLPFAENDYVWHWKSGIDYALAAQMKKALE